MTLTAIAFTFVSGFVLLLMFFEWRIGNISEVRMRQLADAEFARLARNREISACDSDARTKPQIWIGIGLDKKLCHTFVWGLKHEKFQLVINVSEDGRVQTRLAQDSEIRNDSKSPINLRSLGFISGNCGSC